MKEEEIKGGEKAESEEVPKKAYKKRESFLSLATASTSSDEFNDDVRSLSPPRNPINGSSESLQSNSIFVPTPTPVITAAAKLTREESEVIRVRSDEDFKEYLETLSGGEEEEEEEYEKKEEEEEEVAVEGGDDYEDDFT